MASAQVNANSEQCKEERRMGINACKAVLSGQSPSAACCQRARVTNFGCVCPVTTLRLFSLVGGVGRVKQLVEGCGRRVPSRLQCGQMCHCACWKMLRPELKFIYPHDEIEQLQMKAFREWRHVMKTHWKKLGGEQNSEASKRTPYKKVDPDDWKVDPITGELSSVIDTFQQLHCKGNTWRNEYAAAKHPVESAGSVEPGEEVAQPKDLNIMTQVLGPRSHHHKGYGSMPRLKAVGGSRATSSRGTYQDHEKDKVITTLKEQVATQAEQLANQSAQLAT
ncbi:hypothetical protein LguiA_017700 [Lonicera macranthoides]